MAAKIHFFIETTKQKKEKRQNKSKESVKSVYENHFSRHRRHLINNRLRADDTDFLEASL